MLKDNKIGEECGVFAIYDPDGDCARSTYYGLYALQHRGQESCGIAVNNNRDITHYKDMGLVSDVFNDEMLSKLNGTMAVGHVRYSTTGESMRENAQPLVLRYIKGNIALAHNGNLVNKDDLANELSVTGAIFQTTTDTEMIAYTIAKEHLNSKTVEEAVEKTINHLVGAFSLIVMSPQKLIAVRDPWGFRPLCMGRKDKAIIFASETCALDSIGAEFVRDLEPGEIVVVQDGEIKSIKTHVGKKPYTMCIFEYLYFARPDSVIEGQSAHDSRMLAGKYLAQEYPVDADVVVGVPDSGLSAAMGYAEESGIPYGIGFVKNKYIGRTFIQPSQAMRENSVRIKLNVLRSTVEGKRVVMVDDSIVRGTTSKRIVSLLRNFGAKEVHVRSSAPPFMWPCYFGTDVPSRDQLVVCNYSMDGIRELIGADSLGFLSIDSLKKIIPNANCGYCDGCFSGKYPVEIK
ncbi:MAG: amidophosphoribosyltransferase [Oscillospiraceae bacterium]|nr:amidophosphoribosyltransferase [Oscillospiraceae bacterium]